MAENRKKYSPTVRDALLYIRATLCLSQAELASKIHVSKGAVAQWELGTKNPSKLARFVLNQLFIISHDINARFGDQKYGMKRYRRNLRIEDFFGIKTEQTLIARRSGKHQHTMWNQFIEQLDK